MILNDFAGIEMRMVNLKNKKISKKIILKHFNRGIIF